MKNKDTIWTIGIIAVIAVVAIGAVMWQSGAFSTTAKTETPTGAVVKGTSVSAPVVCSDTLTTVVSLKLYNKLNTATSATLNGTAYIYEVQDGSEALIATSSGTSTNTLDCGKTFRVRLVGADATNSSAKILGVRAGKGAVLSPDGKYVEFKTEGASYTLELDGKKHGALTFKLFDIKMNNWVYNNVTGTATVGQPSGAIFYSTAGAGTKMNVTTGQDIDVKYVLRADNSYVDFADFGVVIYVNASVGTWQEPKLSMNGVQLSPAVLSDAEKRKYSEYEYAYKMTDAPSTGALLTDRDVELVFQMSALSDVDPSATVDVLFASASATKQVSGSNIVYATTGDSATNIQPVFSEMTTQIAVV